MGVKTVSVIESFVYIVNWKFVMSFPD